MKYFLIALFSCSMLVACKNEEKPPITVEKMGNILADIQLAEAYSSMVDDSLHRIVPKDQDSLAVYYKKVWASHQISQQQFEQAIDWYKGHPDLLDTAYKHMISELSFQDEVQQAKMQKH